MTGVSRVADALQEVLRPIRHPVGIGPVGLGDHLDGAHLQRRDRTFRLGRAQHDRHRMLTHQLAQEGQAVHPRHLDVEYDHAGHGRLEPLHGFVRV